MSQEESASQVVRVNGEEVAAEQATWPEEAPLAEVLRERLGLCALKVGCDNGSCGSCTILVDGKAVQSCELTWQDVQGSEITTPEGLPEEDRESHAEAFARSGGGCGFCLPGLVMRLHGLGRQGNVPRASLQALLSHHYCRCSGYQAWLEALQRMVRQGQSSAQITLVGHQGKTKLPRSSDDHRGQQRLSQILAGEPSFVDDLRPPEALEGALALVPISWGILQYVDAVQAEHLPGVSSILTSEELLSLRDGTFSLSVDTDTIPSVPRLRAVPRSVTEDSHKTTPAPDADDAPLTEEDELEQDLQYPGKEETSALLHEALAMWEEDDETTIRVPPREELEAEEFEGEDVIERGPSWLRKRGEEIRCCGDVVALVAAKSRSEARHAASCVRSVIEPIDPHFDAEYSYQRENARKVAHQKLSRGDVDQAFRDAFAIVSGTWITSPVDAGELEPPSCVAMPLPSGRMRIISSGRSPLAIQAHVAQVLEWQREQVEVVCMATGGTSSRKQPLIEGFAALMALREGQAVKLTLPRSTASLMQPKRHEMRIHVSLACDERGNFTGLRMHIFADTGGHSAHATEVLQRALVHACGPYRITAYQLEAVAVCSNNPNAGEVSCEGVAQVAFALEGAIDMLSERVDIDCWALRYRNALRPGERLPNGQFLADDCRFAETLEAVRDAYYKYADTAGLACGFKGHGLWHSPSRAREYCVQIRADGDGKFRLFLPYPEDGQGMHDSLLYEAAQSSELPLSSFVVEVSSEACEALMPTMAEPNITALQKAVQEAARGLKQAYLEGEVEEGQLFPGKHVFPASEDEPAVHPDLPRYLSFTYAAQVVVLEPGQGRIRRVISACDIGRPLQYAGAALQIEGALHKGIGYALSEGLNYQEGMPDVFQPDELCTIPPQYSPYFQVILLDEYQPDGDEADTPESKGDGSVAMIPVAPAIAAAIHKVEGERYFALPMRQSLVAKHHNPPKPEVP